MDKHQSIKWPADETIIRQSMSCRHKNIKRLISKQQPLTLLLIEASSDLGEATKFQ